MNIKNLERASEICEELHKLEEARKILSEEVSFIVVRRKSDGGSVVLPDSIKYTMVMQLNVEINKLKEEVTKL